MTLRIKSATFQLVAQSEYYILVQWCKVMVHKNILVKNFEFWVIFTG
jgi:hypothetical protein